MRTTLSIDGKLLDAAKKRANASGVTLGSYVEEALRLQLAARDDRRSIPEIPVFNRGTGLRADFDATSNRALFDALDASGDLT